MLKTSSSGGSEIQISGFLANSEVDGIVDVGFRRLRNATVITTGTTNGALPMQASRRYYNVAGPGGAGITVTVARTDSSLAGALVYAYKACAGATDFYSHSCGGDPAPLGTLGTVESVTTSLTVLQDYIIAIEGSNDSVPGNFSVTVTTNP